MLIQLEFNELCPAFLQELMDREELPHFKRLYESSQVYTTDAGESPPNLEPWIQWVSVHSGMPYREHQVFQLGDGAHLEAPCVGQVLSEAGVRVGICSSMNTNYTTLNGYLLPDPWDQRGVTCPESLTPFFQTVSQQVQESTKSDGFSKRDMMRFGWFMMRHGLRGRTVLAIARQLADEKRDEQLSWRRASMLEFVQYDLFRWLNKRLNVQFATFFANSTAHYQHYYWRNMQPELFAVPPDEDQHESLKQAIPYGYHAMDRIVGNVLRDYPQATVLLCSALSQQAWRDTTKCTYRPRCFAELLRFAGINAEEVTIRPVMAEEVHFELPSPEAAAQASDHLDRLTLNGKPVLRVDRQDKSLFAGCAITDPNVNDIEVHSGENGNARPFHDLFQLVHTMRSGKHHPDGVLWLKNGKHTLNREKVPLTAIAPTVLKHLGVQPPGHMKQRSLPI